MEIQHGGEEGIPRFANRFDRLLSDGGAPSLTRAPTTTLQINLGKLCNQACRHCHVEAGPNRTEIMTAPVAERLIELAGHPGIATVDLTGGAPEMNPHFRRLVTQCAALGKEIVVRCNLTILMEPGFDWLPAFYAEHGAHLICSMPCYTPGNVNRQRGKGVFDKSITALRRLNAIGYGVEGRGLVLDLVYNPLGPFLPPDQMQLEADYRRELSAHFGVSFTRLLTLANLPIGRFARDLGKNGELELYLDLLEESFNPGTVSRLMCRNTLSVGWDGKIYDCDFNQMLDMELGGGVPSILDPDFHPDDLLDVPIRTGKHCLGCTAGAGSSCGGALT